MSESFHPKITTPQFCQTLFPQLNSNPWNLCDILLKSMHYFYERSTSAMNRSNKAKEETNIQENNPWPKISCASVLTTSLTVSKICVRDSPTEKTAAATRYFQRWVKTGTTPVSLLERIRKPRMRLQPPDTHLINECCDCCTEIQI